MLMTNQMLAFGLGTPEIVVILLVVLLLFGGKKLPELARGLGRGLRQFKDEVEGVKTDVRDSVANDPAPKTQEPKTTASSTPPASPPAEQDKQ